MHQRTRALAAAGACAAFLLAIVLAYYFFVPEVLRTDLSLRNQPPGFSHLFGTDWMGRNMLLRTIAGLRLSLQTGLTAAAASALLALFLGLAAGILGGWVDGVVSWLIDIFISLPHLVLLILVSFAFGGGLKGVTVAIAVSHWPRLARIIRAETMQLKDSPFIHHARCFGRTPWQIGWQHILPHLAPQFIVGLLLLFPHAILHEAGLTFVGLGLSPHEPAVGIILAEAMRHLSTGNWWLAVLPGAALLAMVKTFDLMGENVRILLQPRISQE
ncbi:putative D,D-dipeptide transport system permease protein ddpC [Candidatus Electronema halotolerans]